MLKNSQLLSATLARGRGVEAGAARGRGVEAGHFSQLALLYLYIIVALLVGSCIDSWKANDIIPAACCCLALAQ